MTRDAEPAYTVPPELVAKQPVEALGGARSDARMVVVDRRNGAVEHRRFFELAGVLGPGDVLVLNNSRVLPSVLRGTDERGHRVVVQVYSPMEDGSWHAQVVAAEPDRRAGEEFTFDGCDGSGRGLDRVRLSGRLVREETPGEWRIVLTPPGPEALERAATLFYPHYLGSRPRPEHYQNVYGSRPGGIMLPSAGRHFTPELLRQLTELGVAVAEVTLDIGVKWGVVRLATWLRETAGITEPVLPEGTARTPADERGNFPGAEHYDVSIETADTINARRRAGGRVVVCGTTVMRTLETVTDDAGRVWPGHGWTRLVIDPGHRFRSCDAFMTNLHMPTSSELQLTASLVGGDRLPEIYRTEIVPRGYRFYEFGDSMVIV
ncbi:S-adenosylmethionine:tRNA ribosyltransferase-isomerase [Kitasatospora sp. RB6PN24]|uniref:S-adenosylmethionine:tRNA ribosyltransferase-isomerase n=1 Tax=Kitasatospora humi TaxID=2893891 RepID=UPI001E5035DB|nr:S-adenosylmethionine:tRNA ribosyltransferase-isomerase [Kitasatospora humi]MCC9307125.1 S-adenosylmethionine:tRNA ribosyltransferase-isomerase [Kitasatospora humi]